MRRVLVVSPHRDDAAFSCSIAIRELRSAFSVIVANYFTVSEYAPFRTDELGTVTELRLKEDLAFAEFGGFVLKDLNLFDAPERLEIDVSEISTLRPLDEADAAVRETVAGHIRSLAPDLLLLPLAIGDHIDHRIARDSGIYTSIQNLAFYEDLPYSARAARDAPEIRARDLGLGLVPWQFSSLGAEQWKHECASLYPSQIDAATMQEIAGFSLRYNEGERFWVTGSAAALLKSIQLA